MVPYVSWLYIYTDTDTTRKSAPLAASAHDAFPRGGCIVRLLCGRVVRCVLLHEHGPHHAVDVHRRRHHSDAHPRRPQEQGAALAQTGPFNVSTCPSVCLSVCHKEKQTVARAQRDIFIELCSIIDKRCFYRSFIIIICICSNYIKTSKHWCTLTERDVPGYI